MPRTALINPENMILLNQSREKTVKNLYGRTADLGANFCNSGSISSGSSAVGASGSGPRASNALAANNPARRTSIEGSIADRPLNPKPQTLSPASKGFLYRIGHRPSFSTVP